MANKFYYIGTRSTDLATSFDANRSDPFFAGSITLYGDNRHGNIAYNVSSGIQLSTALHLRERNSAILKMFIKNHVTDIVAHDPSARFLPYDVGYAEKVPAKFKKRIVCCNEPALMTYLNSKFNFKKLIEGKLPQAAHIYMTGADVLAKLESGEFPNTKEVVIQTEYGSAGEGTYFATKSAMSIKKYCKSCMSKIKAHEMYVVSDFVPTHCSVSCHIQISANEVAVYPPGIQLMRGPKFIGSDLFAFSQLPVEIQEDCRATAVRFGEILREYDPKARGYFGLDLIVAKSDNKVYAIETNARFTGTTGLMNILSHKAGIGSVFEHTYEAFYAKSTNLTEKFRRITPSGRKRYAEVSRDEDGSLHFEDGKSNREGLDKTAYQEDDIYTYSIFEEIKGYNVYDDRIALKKITSRVKVKK
ncbi:MAG: ATP-grasp domain-containing protein [Firmicutes bacterium]|nr:ATP-grasp domain-containing protein [Bacillota bacterium]